MVEHGGFFELEADGVEGFGVVALAAGDDDAAGVVGGGGCYVDLRTGSGVEGFGSEGEVAFVPPYCLGDVLASGAAVVNDDDDGVLIDTSADFCDFAEGMADVGVFVDVTDVEEEEGVDEGRLLGSELGGHLEIFGFLAMDAVFGADEEVFEGLGMGGHAGEGPSEDLTDGDLHGDAALPGASLADEGG